MADSGGLIIFKAHIHCDGCARDARRCLERFNGVEGVTIDAANHIIAVKGRSVDPNEVLKRLRKKFSKAVELLSPVPQPAQPRIVCQTVVIKVLMHCPGCVKDAVRGIYKLKGVHKVERGPVDGTFAVTGWIEEPQLLEHVKKHVNKYAEIVKPEQPPALAEPEQPPAPAEIANPEQPPAPAESYEAEANPPPAEPAAYFFPRSNYQYPNCEMLNDENTSSCCVM